MMQSASLLELRIELVTRLERRRAEIEQALLTRVYAVSDPAEVGDSGYVEGLRAAASAGLSYALAGIQKGDPSPQPVPAALLDQARLAAQEGVSLDTVVRRYVVGHTLLADALMQEAQALEQLDHDALKSVLRALGMLLEGLLAAVSEEYNRASAGRAQSSDQRRANLVKQLLDGDLVDPGELEYDLSLFHLGMLMAGPGVEASARYLCAQLDYRRLVVRPGRGVAWIWLGAGDSIAPDAVRERLTGSLPPGFALSLGEPGAGLGGWRRTHYQAKAAWPIARRQAGRPVRYASVALLATAIKDELLAASLLDIYMAPLACEHDGGEALRRTLGAYFGVGRNASSAAAKLGVSRQTVNERLRKIEEHLDSPLDSCAPELETALRLYDLDRTA